MGSSDTTQMDYFTCVYHTRAVTTNVFCKISFWKNKSFLGFSKAWGQVKTSRGPVHYIHVQFSKLVKQIPYELFFCTFHSLCYAIFRRKKKPKIFGLENWMERGVKKTLNFKFVKLTVPSKIFEKTILNPLYLECKSRSICGEKRRSQATCHFEGTQVTLGRPNR